MASDEYHYRTAVTRLSVSSGGDRLLRETLAEWLDGCNLVSEMAWDTCHTKSDVQSLAYERIRNETGLSSQHAVLATHHVAEAIMSCVNRRRNGKKATRPEFTAPTMTFDERTMTIFPGKEVVTLTTHGDHPRVRANLVLPGNEEGYQYRYLAKDEWEPTESTLHYRDGHWYLHLGFRKPKTDSESSETTENGTVLGVDLGVQQIAVTSTARFFSAAELNHRREEFERIRDSLQRCGSRSASRTLDRVNGRETEYAKHVLHTVANGIVEEALDHGCAGIVFEKLSGIQNRIPDADWHSTWAFNALYDYVEYKAESEGLFVETTSPTNTSRRCPECGWTDPANRVSRNTFDCQSCDCTGHADYIAAKNVADLFLRRGRQSSRRRGVSRYALKSGTVTPNRGYTPYPDGSEDESTDECCPG